VSADITPIRRADPPPPSSPIVDRIDAEYTAIFEPQSSLVLVIGDRVSGDDDPLWWRVHPTGSARCVSWGSSSATPRIVSRTSGLPSGARRSTGSRTRAQERRPPMGRRFRSLAFIASSASLRLW
jgi:hypothetical protein